MKNVSIKSKKIAVFDPYLDVLGGGEKHILSIAQIFDQYGFEINILWDNPFIAAELKNRLNISFSNFKIIPNFLYHKESIEKILKTKEYAYFFYVTNGSCFFSLSPRNYIFSMYPKKELYKSTIINKLKWLNFNFIANSKFTKSFIDKWTNKKSQVIYPYINFSQIIKEKNFKKDKIILTVGRFFKQLHSKRQDFIIKSFKELQQRYEQFKDFKLYLIGGLKEEDKYYFEELKSLADNNPNIVFLPNVSYSALLEYYQKAMFFWHAAGYDIDEQKHPELAEHLGITPLEAMIFKCLTFCYPAGGIKEIIKHRINGFLYKNGNELIEQTLKIYQDKVESEIIIQKAKQYIAENFSYEVFKKNVVNYFNLK